MPISAAEADWVYRMHATRKQKWEFSTEQEYGLESSARQMGNVVVWLEGLFCLYKERTDRKQTTWRDTEDGKYIVDPC